MVSYSGRIQPQEEGDKERGSISMRKKTKKEKEKERTLWVGEGIKP